MKLSTAFTAIVVLIVVIQEGKSLHYPQYMQIFLTKSCVGESDRDFLTSTDFDTNDDPIFKSISGRGIWRYTTAHDLRVYEASRSSGDCLTLTNTRPPVGTLTSLTMILPSDLDESALSFFNTSDYAASPITVIGETESVFQTPLNVHSWAITGLQSFTVFENSNFTGQSICLQHDNSEKDWGLAFQFEAELPFRVSSVRVGCDASTRNILRGSGESVHIVTDSKGNEVKRAFTTASNPLTIKV